MMRKNTLNEDNIVTPLECPAFELEDRPIYIAVENINDENCPFNDVVKQVKDITYGFINAKDGSRVEDREFIHNCKNLPEIYHTNTNPLVTLSNKLGICMDQSLAIKYLMDQLHPDYQCKLYALFKGRFGHCVPCMCANDKWYYYENAWDKERGLHGPFDSNEELKDYLQAVYQYRHMKDTTEPAEVQDFTTDLMLEEYAPMHITLDENVKATKAQREYSDYLIKHISNTKRGFFWIKQNAPEMLAKCNKKHVENNLIIHDESKYSAEEYDTYAEFFYGNRTPEVAKDFKVAVQHHFMNNPHHPEYWHGLPMPEDYIIEMICDWWSFSWKDNDMYSIFDFWENKAKDSKSKSIHPTTKARLQELLDMLRAALDKFEEK